MYIAKIPRRGKGCLRPLYDSNFAPLHLRKDFVPIHASLYVLTKTYNISRYILTASKDTVGLCLVSLFEIINAVNRISRYIIWWSYWEMFLIYVGYASSMHFINNYNTRNQISFYLFRVIPKKFDSTINFCQSCARIDDFCVCCVSICINKCPTKFWTSLKGPE